MSTSLANPRPVRSSSRRKRPSVSPTVGKLLIPEKPSASSSRSKTDIWRIGSVPITPAITGVSLTTGRTSRSPISFTIALASPKARMPARLPCPAIRNRPEL